MPLIRETHSHLYRIVNDGKIDKEKQGILFNVSEGELFNFKRCKEFYLVFSQQDLSLQVRTPIRYYTANNGKKYILVSISDFDTLPKGQVNLIFQEEVNVSEFKFEGLNLQFVINQTLDSYSKFNPNQA